MGVFIVPPLAFILAKAQQPRVHASTFCGIAPPQLAGYHYMLWLCGGARDLRTLYYTYVNYFYLVTCYGTDRLLSCTNNHGTAPNEIVRAKVI